MQLMRAVTFLGLALAGLPGSAGAQTVNYRQARVNFGTLSASYADKAYWQDVLDVRYVDFPRPRMEILSLIGEANQSCPVLVIADGPPPGVESMGYQAPWPRPPRD